MDHYFPNSAWIRLRRDAFDRLYDYKVHGVPDLGTAGGAAARQRATRWSARWTRREDRRSGALQGRTYCGLYCRSIPKNQQRWTFEEVPARLQRGARPGRPWIMQTQCLVAGDGGSTIEVNVRFLHVTERKVGRRRGSTCNVSRWNSSRSCESETTSICLGRGDRAGGRGRRFRLSDLRARGSGDRYPRGLARKRWGPAGEVGLWCAAGARCAER